MQLNKETKPNLCLYPRVAKDRSQKLIYPFVPETTESACISITVVIDIFNCIQHKCSDAFLFLPLFLFSHFSLWAWHNFSKQNSVTKSWLYILIVDIRVSRYYYSWRVFFTSINRWSWVKLEKQYFFLVSRILLGILADLNNAVVSKISVGPPISNSPTPLPFAIIMTIIFMFHSFLSSLARSMYSSLFRFSLIFTRWSTFVKYY